jgi:hypothetical protein
MTKKLLVAMDSGRFKAFRVEYSRHFSHPRLCPLEDWDTDVNKRISEQVTDQRGQFSKGARSFAAVNDMADGERHNLDLEMRRRAVKSMADRIDELLKKEDVDGCFVAARKEIYDAVMDSLGRPARDRVEMHLAANLTKLNPDQILSQLPKSLNGAPGRE